MALSINLAPLDMQSAAIAETNPEKINEFTKNLRHADTFQAASRLLQELKVLTREKMEPNLRINTLEQYRKITLELSNDLEEIYGNAPIPLSIESRNIASVAEALWLETGYGYKRALVDLKHKLFNLKGNKQDTLVILRAIEALRNEAQVSYLTYGLPSEALWSDLHKIYYHALQLSVEDVEILELTQSHSSTINQVYSQTLLMYLANPQRLDKPSIRKMARYLAGLSKYAQLRGIGFVENSNGIFLVELDSKKPPIAYLKSKTVPNIETDILLLTVEVARQIHQQLKFIQENKSSTSNFGSDALEVADEDLLVHLIKYFGITPTRVFNRLEKQDTLELAIGFISSNIVFRSNKRPDSKLYSTWEVMNISPHGYALRAMHIDDITITVGEITAIREKADGRWALGYVIWLITKSTHVEAGIKLISPTAKSINIKKMSESGFESALLLPEISSLNQTQSIVCARGYLAEKSIIDTKEGNKKSSLQINHLIERTANFERFEFSLIDNK